MKKLLFLLLVFFTVLAGFCQKQTPGNTTGDHQQRFGVGFRSFLLYDSSRPSLKEQAELSTKVTGRVIQTNLWYPTTDTKLKKMEYADYLLLKATEISGDVTEEKKTEIVKSMLLKNYNTSHDSILHLFISEHTLTAMQNAGFATGRFPLIVLMHNDPTGFAPMAERLASHGFVVVNFPISGTSSKQFDWQTISGIETELRDLDFVVNAISAMPVVDSSCIIPAGYSYGAMAALAYQLRNKNVKGIISLDGGIGSIWGGEMLFKLPDFKISSFTKPIFHAWSDIEKYYDHKWLENYIFSDRFLMKFSKLRHGDFVEGILFEKLVPGITQQVLGKALGGGKLQHQHLLQSVTAFALWIATGNKAYELQLNDMNLPLTRIKKWNCTTT